MLITLDPFYDVEFYNRCKNSLENNKCEYREFICVRPPFNWYLDIKTEPNLLDYTKAERIDKQHMVSVAKPIKTADFWKHYRRGNDTRDNISRFIVNDAFEEASKSTYSAFVHIRSKEQALKLSANMKGIKLWYFGKFYRNKYRVYLINSELVPNFIPREDILITKDNDLVTFEKDLNFKIFKLQDLLIKNSETVYMLNGRIQLPSYKNNLPKF